MVKETLGSRGERPAVGRGKPRVLLIDDEPKLTEALRHKLSGTGDFVVEATNSAIMGIEAARSFKPDIIILDVCMPFFDGGDVAATLALDPELKDIKLIFLTSLISRDDTSGESYLFSAGQVMMPKPVDAEKLILCIYKSLAGQLERGPHQSPSSRGRQPGAGLC